MLNQNLNLNIFDEFLIKLLQKWKIVDKIKEWTTFWSIFKLVLIFVCVGSFSFMAISVVTRYKAHNTMVRVDYQQPDETALPAITICSYSFISDEALSLMYWKEWYTFSNTSLGDKYAIREKLRAKALEDMSAADIFNDTSITFDSLVSRCFFHPNVKNDSYDKIPCNQITSTVESIYYGRKCYTLFSHLNVTKESYPVINLDYKMASFLKISLVTQQDIDLDDHTSYEQSIYFIHSPNIIPTISDAKCFKLEMKPGRLYDSRFKKQISFMMQPPYKTMCRWYSQDNPPGERSRGDCLNRCIKRLTFDSCFSYFSIVTRDLLDGDKQKICTKDKSNQEQMGNARIECTHRCQLTCIEEFVELPFASYAYINSTETYIRIRSSTMLYAFVHHREAIDINDFMANLGAHAHIWLGLSAIKIFNWIVHLIHYMRRSLIKYNH